MNPAPWKAWFEQAHRAGTGGDLALLADLATDKASRLDARVAAIRALRAAGATAFAHQQLQRLLLEAPGLADTFNTVTDLAAPHPENAETAIVFSGHIVDRPGRGSRRFPGESVEGVSSALRTALEELQPVAGNPAMTGAAAGADLLFIESALAVRMNVTVCLPFSEPRFLETSVDSFGTEWRSIYERLRSAPGLTLRQMPSDMAESDSAAFELCNRWMIYLALSSGAPRLRGLVVWDGKAGDGPGGASHMISLLAEFDVPTRVITPETL